MKCDECGVDDENVRQRIHSRVWLHDTCPTPPKEYTLLEYAKVIEWLWAERHDVHQKHPYGVHMSDFPPGLAEVFNDALQRAALGRVARAMEAAEEES